MKGDLGTSTLDGFFRVPAILVGAAVGVTKLVGEEGKHGIEDAEVYGCGGLKIKIGRFEG